MPQRAVADRAEVARDVALLWPGSGKSTFCGLRSRLRGRGPPALPSLGPCSSARRRLRAPAVFASRPAAPSAAVLVLLPGRGDAGWPGARLGVEGTDPSTCAVWCAVRIIIRQANSASGRALLHSAPSTSDFHLRRRRSDAPCRFGSAGVGSALRTLWTSGHIRSRCNHQFDGGDDAQDPVVGSCGDRRCYLGV